MQTSRKQKKMQKLHLAKQAADQKNKKVHKETPMPADNPLLLDEQDARIMDTAPPAEETKDNLQFEDEFDDVWEEEVAQESDAENSEDYDSVDDSEFPQATGGQDMMMEEKPDTKKYLLKDKAEKKEPETVTPYIGTGEGLANDEFLDFENRTYDMIHRSTAEWPCMSIDFLLPNQQNSGILAGYQQQFLTEWEYPIEAYAVSGSMASLPSKNQLYLLKFANLMKTKYDDDSEVSADEDELLEDEPVIFHQAIPLKSGVNRIRAMNNTPIVAFWDESRKVQIYDLRKNLEYLVGVNKETPKYELKPKGDGQLLKQFTNSDEGFGLEWSPHQSGRLLTGASNGHIYQILQNDELCADFTRDEKPYE
jgi:ribosome assembly protein RRB1